MPINVVLILLLLSLFFFKKRPHKSFKCLLAAILLLFMSSMPVVSDHFMVQIENNYETFTQTSKPVDYIIVLGGWHISNPALPATSELQVASSQRLIEALRIFALHPEAKIITSGHHSSDEVSNAQKMKQALMLLGVPEQKIITENFPKDTEEEAQLIAPRVLGTSVVLITSAEHMPRAIRYFRNEGIEPIPAPTGYWVKNIDSPKNWGYYVPSSKKLQQTTVAWYESVGLLVQWVKGLFTV